MRCSLSGIHNRMCCGFKSRDVNRISIPGRALWGCPSCNWRGNHSRFIPPGAEGAGNYSIQYGSGHRARIRASDRGIPVSSKRLEMDILVVEYNGLRLCSFAHARWLILKQNGAVTLCAFLFLRESNAVTVLARKTRYLRKQTGNMNLRSTLETGRSPRTMFKIAIFRPCAMLIRSPVQLATSLIVGIMYGYLYLLFTTFPEVFEDQYGFATGPSGLVYIGLGVGYMIAMPLFTLTSDRYVRWQTQKGKYRAEDRLPPLILGAALVPIGLFWYASPFPLAFINYTDAAKVWLECKSENSLDCAHYWDHSYRIRHAACISRHDYISGGCIHALRSVSIGWKHNFPFYAWGIVTTGWPAHVRESGPWLGKLPLGFYCYWHICAPRLLVALRGDTESSVPD